MAGGRCGGWGGPGMGCQLFRREGHSERSQPVASRRLALCRSYVDPACATASRPAWAGPANATPWNVARSAVGHRFCALHSRHADHIGVDLGICHGNDRGLCSHHRLDLASSPACHPSGHCGIPGFGRPRVDYGAILRCLARNAVDLDRRDLVGSSSGRAGAMVSCGSAVRPDRGPDGGICRSRNRLAAPYQRSARPLASDVAIRRSGHPFPWSRRDRRRLRDIELGADPPGRDHERGDLDTRAVGRSRPWRSSWRQLDRCDARWRNCRHCRRLSNRTAGHWNRSRRPKRFTVPCGPKA
jgi:hypothetical protein